MSDEVYSRIVHYDENKDVQVRIGVNVFRDVEYLFFRKYYMDYEGEWRPSKEGVNIPLTMSNSREMFAGLLDILSLGEQREEIVENFKELLKEAYTE